jgi:hypothetical protein
MTHFTTAFTPALNKSGYAKLTFVAIKTLTGKAGDISEKTGEIYHKDWEITNLLFECHGMVRGTTQTISLKISSKYAPDNGLGILLRNMGYVEPTFKTELDEDGFEIVAMDEDEDGFSSVDNLDLGIDEFIDSCVGKTFIAKVKREIEGNNKGKLTIDINSLKPFISKKK